MRVRHSRSIRVPAGVPAGVLATVTMDIAMAAASYIGRSAFTSDRLGPSVIGRWAVDLTRRRWLHADITTEPAQRGELELGILTHDAYGWFGLRSGDAARLSPIMLLGHVALGVGIGLWTPRFAERRSSRSSTMRDDL